MQRTTGKGCLFHYIKKKKKLYQKSLLRDWKEKL